MKVWGEVGERTLAKARFLYGYTNVPMCSSQFKSDKVTLYF